MKYLLLLLVFPIISFANEDRCEEISEVAFGQAVMRGPVFQMIKTENPDPPMNEMWRYLALSASEKYDKLGVSIEEQESIAKDIERAKFTKNFQADSFLIKEYYYAKCITYPENLRYKSLSKVKAKKMASCWEDRESDVGLRSCVLEAVAKP